MILQGPVNLIECLNFFFFFPKKIHDMHGEGLDELWNYPIVILKSFTALDLFANSLLDKLALC